MGNSKISSAFRSGLLIVRTCNFWRGCQDHAAKTRVLVREWSILLGRMAASDATSSATALLDLIPQQIKKLKRLGNGGPLQTAARLTFQFARAGSGRKSTIRNERIAVGEPNAHVECEQFTESHLPRASLRTAPCAAFRVPVTHLGRRLGRHRGRPFSREIHSAVCLPVSRSRHL